MTLVHTKFMAEDNENENGSDKSDYSLPPLETDMNKSSDEEVAARDTPSLAQKPRLNIGMVKSV